METDEERNVSSCSTHEHIYDLSLIWHPSDTTTACKIKHEGLTTVRRLCVGGIGASWEALVDVLRGRVNNLSTCPSIS